MFCTLRCISYCKCLWRCVCCVNLCVCREPSVSRLSDYLSLLSFLSLNPRWGCSSGTQRDRSASGASFLVIYGTPPWPWWSTTLQVSVLYEVFLTLSCWPISCSWFFSLKNVAYHPPNPCSIFHSEKDPRLVCLVKLPVWEHNKTLSLHARKPAYSVDVARSKRRTLTCYGAEQRIYCAIPVPYMIQYHL